MDERTLSPEEPTTQSVQAYLDEERLDELQLVINELHPADIADILDELPGDAALKVFDLLSDEVASEVLDETGSLIRAELVEKVDDERLADLLDELPMDDAAEFLDDLPDETASRLLHLMEPEEAQDVLEILSYGDETAGRLMTRDVAALRRMWTVSEAIEYLRSLVLTDETETVHYLYVVDRDERLIGVVPIRKLLLAQPDITIEDIMVPGAITIEDSADQEELAELVSKYDFVAIPVVDKGG
ncbi:MAG: magnesium transporter, partial [bacterium]